MIAKVKTHVYLDTWDHLGQFYLTSRDFEREKTVLMHCICPETKEALGKCMKSMIDKSGKLRHLLRDLTQNYGTDAAAKQRL